MNRSGRSLNRLYPEDYGRQFKEDDRYACSLYGSHDRRKWFRHPETAGKVYGIADRSGRSSYRSSERSSRFVHQSDEDEESHRRSYKEYLMNNRACSHGRRISQEKMYDERYMSSLKGQHQDVNRRERSLKKEWDDEMNVSREREQLCKYEEWMTDKGWIRNYEGNWERSRIEKKGFRWEKAKYYEKYTEWEVERNHLRESGRRKSQQQMRNWNVGRYEGTSDLKENWYNFEEDSFNRCRRGSLGGRISRYSISDQFISNASSNIQNPKMKRGRSPVPKFSQRLKRSNSEEHSSNKKMLIKSEDSSTRRNEIKESVSRSKLTHTSESPPAPRLKSEVGLVPTERLRRPRKKGFSIQRPCDFYQKDTCLYPSWHNDRTGCCRLHVCAFCFYQNDDVVKRGTPVLNLHKGKDCPRFSRRIKIRSKSLDRCQRNQNKIDYPSNKEKDDFPISFKPRCKSLDRRFGNREASSKTKKDFDISIIEVTGKSLDMRFGNNVESSKLNEGIEMSNIVVTVYNDSRKDDCTESDVDPKNQRLGNNSQSKEEAKKVYDSEENMEEITDTETDDSENDLDEESERSTDGSRKSSEESDATASEADDSGQEDRIKLLKAIYNVAKMNDGSKDKNKNKSKVHISGLCPQVSQDDIHSLFSTIGKLEEAKLVGNGKAQVAFENVGDALLAVIKFNNKYLDGKKLSCSVEQSSREMKQVISEEEKMDTTLQNGITTETSPINEHDEENEVSSPKNKNNDKMEDTEREVTLNEEDTEGEVTLNEQDKDTKNTNEDTIDLNISQDLF